MDTQEVAYFHFKVAKIPLLTVLGRILTYSSTFIVQLLCPPKDCSLAGETLSFHDHSTGFLVCPSKEDVHTSVM